MPLFNWTDIDLESPFDWEFNSTALSSGSYNPLTQTLTIEFNQRGTYEYYDVPVHIVIGLAQSSSAGRYFNAVIRDNYAYSMIG